MKGSTKQEDIDSLSDNSESSRKPSRSRADSDAEALMLSPTSGQQHPMRVTHAKSMRRVTSTGDVFVPHLHSTPHSFRRADSDGDEEVLPPAKRPDSSFVDYEKSLMERSKGGHSLIEAFNQINVPSVSLRFSRVRRGPFKFSSRLNPFELSEKELQKWADIRGSLRDPPPSLTRSQANIPRLSLSTPRSPGSPSPRPTLPDLFSAICSTPSVRHQNSLFFIPHSL